MRKKVDFIFLFCLLMAVLIPQLTFAEADWKQVKNSDGITVYNRPFPGSDVDEFRSVAVVNAPIEVITEVLYDVSAQPEWISDCQFSKTVKVFDENHIIYYNILNVPWPVTDRDSFVDMKFDLDFKSGRVLVAFRAVDEPLDSKYVRMTFVSGSCLLERMEKDKTKVTYTMIANPAGNIPGAIANIFAKINPYNTLKGLKKMVLKTKYIEIAKKKYSL